MSPTSAGCCGKPAGSTGWPAAISISAAGSTTRSPTSPLTGRLKLGPYRLQKVTPRADVGTLNSTIDGLSRAGDALQQFDSLETSVIKTGDRIELKDGHTAGKSIGLTTAGIIDLAKDYGAPARHRRAGLRAEQPAVERAAARAAADRRQEWRRVCDRLRLEGPLDDLKTDINMMSAMTPGALRELFISGDRHAPKPRPVDRAP